MKAEEQFSLHPSQPAEFRKTSTLSNPEVAGVFDDATAVAFGNAAENGVVEQPLRGHSLVRRMRAHVPTATIRTLVTHLGLTLKEMANLLGLTERTLARRLEQPEGHLDTAESERLLLLRNLALHGIATFEDIDKFNRWLRRPLPVLEGRSPLAYLDTVTSFQVVDQLLGRLEHGIYS